MSAHHWAILIMLIATSLTSFSSVVLKIAATKMQPMESQSLAQNVAALLTNKLWLIGFALSASAVMLNWVALGLGDMSTIQPLSGFGLIVLAIAAHNLLNEKISFKEIVGIGFAIGGVVIIGANASPNHNKITLDTLLATYMHTKSIAWICALALFIPSSWWACRALGYRGAGVVFALQTSVATLLGLTFSKGFFESLGNGVASDVFTSPIAILFATLFIFLAFLALFLQQFALQKGRSVVVVPIINTMQVALPIPTGFFVFHEIPQNTQLFGVLVLFAGVLLLTLKRPAQNAKITTEVLP